MIQNAWVLLVTSFPWRGLCAKQLAKRRAIQQWNKCTVGNVFEAIKGAKSQLVQAEMKAKSEDSEEAHIRLQKAKAKFRHALAIEKQFWSQKSRVKWLSCRDRNSKFFHAAIKQRRVEGTIHRI